MSAAAFRHGDGCLTGTHALVRRLAEVTGTSQTSAVEDAVRRRLAELEAEGASVVQAADHQRVERLLVEFRRDLTDEDRRTMSLADDAVYDEHGLPR
ncbi:MULTISPECIES: type II toxin-antitoxin system VapB family antitoxin [Mumia]|uniref:type II toxin-antitoxin system VapB family antitoxin n=1 Tax=Mumia TaxID=1546255 RepID=UPI001422F03F|nr:MULTISPECIES: type II toxin-antitoxin system VapB family antitoxin [unclassified Mumia]QMW67145.1 type II toxin-antitoxin system VapB family antitoxin [Mumia sp. ZJ1417]